MREEKKITRVTDTRLFAMLSSAVCLRPVCQLNVFVQSVVSWIWSRRSYIFFIRINFLMSTQRFRSTAATCDIRINSQKKNKYSARGTDVIDLILPPLLTLSGPLRVYVSHACSTIGTFESLFTLMCEKERERKKCQKLRVSTLVCGSIAALPYHIHIQWRLWFILYALRSSIEFPNLAEFPIHTHTHKHTPADAMWLKFYVFAARIALPSRVHASHVARCIDIGEDAASAIFQETEFCYFSGIIHFAIYFFTRPGYSIISTKTAQKNNNVNDSGGGDKERRVCWCCWSSTRKRLEEREHATAAVESSEQWLSTTR